MLEPTVKKENALQGKYESRASRGKKHGFKVGGKYIGTSVLQNFTQEMTQVDRVWQAISGGHLVP